MKAFILREYNERMVLENVEDPKPGPSDIILKVKNCGICFTDIKIVTGQIPSPIIQLPHTPGHEIAGEVVAVGPEVKNIAVGQRGIAYQYVCCRDCEMCRSGRENVCLSLKRIGFELPGGFAEFVKLPAYNFCPFNEGSFSREMAILPDAVATSYHALRQMAEVKIGDDILVVGVGGLGIHMVQIAGLMGAKVIAADKRREALKLASEFGVEFIIDTSSEDPLKRVLDITRGVGVDTVMEVVGSPETLEWSLHCLKRRGILVMVGYDPLHPYPVNSMEMHYNEWTIRGSRATTKQELVEVIDLVEAGKIRPVVSKEFMWTKANEGLEEVQSGRIIGRIVLGFD